MLGWIVGMVLLAGLIILVQVSVGWTALLSPWREVRPSILLASSVLMVGSYGVRAVRVHEYFRPATAGGFLATVRLVLLHNLLNNLLPMRTGEASFPILMRRQFQVPFSRSVPGLFYLRLLDLHFVLLLGFTALAWSRGSLGLALVLLLTPVPLILFWLQRMLGSRLQAAEGSLGRVSRRVLEGLPTSAPVFWKTWAWTVVNWGVKLAVLAWILRVFTSLPYSFALLGTTTGELSSVLPIHGVAGAGTYEAGVLAGLLPLGVHADPALAGAVNLHLFVLGVSFLAGILGAFLPARPTSSGGSAGDS